MRTAAPRNFLGPKLNFFPREEKKFLGSEKFFEQREVVWYLLSVANGNFAVRLGLV